MKIEGDSIYIVQGIKEYFPDKDGTLETKWFDSAYTDMEEAFGRACELAWNVYEEYKNISNDRKNSRRLLEPAKIGEEIIEEEFGFGDGLMSNVIEAYRCSLGDKYEPEVFEIFTSVVYQFCH